MENKPTLEHFKGTATEAKFSNCMTLELWYSGSKHKYEDAKTLMSEVVKCWNMHDELLEALKVCFKSLNTYGKHPIIEKQVNVILKKATE